MTVRVLVVVMARRGIGDRQRGRLGAVRIPKINASLTALILRRIGVAVLLLLDGAECKGMLGHGRSRRGCLGGGDAQRRAARVGVGCGAVRSGGVDEDGMSALRELRVNRRNVSLVQERVVSIRRVKLNAVEVFVGGWRWLQKLRTRRRRRHCSRTCAGRPARKRSDNQALGHCRSGKRHMVLASQLVNKPKPNPPHSSTPRNLPDSRYNMTLFLAPTPFQRTNDNVPIANNHPFVN